jgi:hypothetical protein
LADCLSPQSVSTIVSQDSSPTGWLSQFLALRDVSQFVVGASIQHTVNKGTCDERLQSFSGKTRNAVLHALDNIRMPAHLSKLDLIATFCETFRIILSDTPHLLRRNSSEPQTDECEIDALDVLRVRLTDRHVVHRLSDREMMNSITEITRNIALLDDPSGQFRATRPILYVANCKGCHFAGNSQLRYLQDPKFPVRLEPL